MPFHPTLQAVGGRKEARQLMSKRPDLLAKRWADEVPLALEVMRLCGVADPAATLVRLSPKDSTDPGTGVGPWVNARHALVDRLALQRAFGLTPAQVSCCAKAARHTRHPGWLAAENDAFAAVPAAQVYEMHGELLCSSHLYPTHANRTVAYLLLLVEEARLRPLSIQTSRPGDLYTGGWVCGGVGDYTSYHRVYIAVDAAGMGPAELSNRLRLAGTDFYSVGDAGQGAFEQLQADARQEAARLNALLPPDLKIPMPPA